MVASAAPVTRFVAPGPIEVVQAIVDSRLRIGVTGGQVNHGLLVAALVIRQGARLGQLGLEQGLPHSREVAVPEDAEAAREQPLLGAVPLGHLVGEERDDRLRHGQP